MLLILWFCEAEYSSSSWETGKHFTFLIYFSLPADLGIETYHKHIAGQECYLIG